MTKTNPLLAGFMAGIAVMLVADVILDVAKAVRPPEPVQSVCVKEDAKTTVCYCRR